MLRVAATLLATLALSVSSFVARAASDVPEEADIRLEADRRTDGGAAHDDVPATTIHALTLDKIYSQLATAPDAETAQRYEQELLRRYHQSGSDTVDLLLSWAMQAMRDKSYPIALDVLDRIVIMKPDFAEGWNKRATVYFATKEYGQSLADIEKVLRIEPRHFGALVGLGTILVEMDQKTRAYDAFEKALAVNPHLETAKEAVKQLEKSGAAGRPI